MTRQFNYGLMYRGSLDRYTADAEGEGEDEDE